MFKNAQTKLNKPYGDLSIHRLFNFKELGTSLPILQTDHTPQLHSIYKTNDWNALYLALHSFAAFEMYITVGSLHFVM